MIDCPCSWYSFWVIQRLLNESNEVRIEPPIQAECFLSWGALTLIIIVEGARALISLNSRLFNPVFRNGIIDLSEYDETEHQCLNLCFKYHRKSSG